MVAVNVSTVFYDDAHYSIWPPIQNIALYIIYVCRWDISHIIILHNHYVSLNCKVVVTRFTEFNFVSVKSFCSICDICMQCATTDSWTCMDSFCR